MKRIKYITALILFSLVFLLKGELFQSYADCFADFYTTTFYPSENVSEADMLADISDTAKEYNVSVFVVEKTVTSLFSEKIDIYASDKILEFLEDQYMISQQKYPSIFSGETEIFYHEFEEIPSEVIHANKPTYFLIGEEKAMNDYKASLIDKYGGHYPRQDGYDSRADYKRTIAMVWIIVLGILILLTCYDIAGQKKSLFLRFSFGERIHLILLKNIIADILAYSLIFALVSLAFSRITTAGFYFSVSLTMLFVLLLVNSAVYLFMMKINMKKALSNVKISGQLLAFNYVIKAITMLITVLILSANFNIFYNCITYYNQKPFFEENKNSSYVEFYSDSFNNHVTATELLYRRYVDEYKIQYLDPLYNYNGSNNAAVLTNYNSLSFLKKWIPEIFEQDLSLPAYIIAPEAAGLQPLDINMLQSFLSKYLEDTAYYDNYENIPVLYYKEDVKIISVEGDLLNHSEWTENPVLMYLNISSYSDISNDDFVLGMNFRSYNFIVDAPEESIAEFADEFGCKCSTTNVKEFFNYRWGVLKRLLLLCSIFSAIIIGLNLAVTLYTISLEYQARALWHSVSKVLGDSLFVRLKALYKNSVIPGVFSAACAVAAVIILNIGFGIFTALISFLFIAIDCVIIFLYAKHMDKKNIPRILKGGNLL